MTDGGRLQIRDSPQASKTSDVATPAGEPEAEPDWDDTPPGKGHWREDKIGLLLTMTSLISGVDPCPTVPDTFLDIARIPKLVRQLKSVARAGEDAVAEPDEDAADTAEAESEEAETADKALAADGIYEPPEVHTRQVQATRQPWQQFTLQMASAAWQLGFQKASRKAFVADGSANNWRLHKRYFSSFEPILDFIHALSYVYASATAGQSLETGWLRYQEWIGWVWSGEVSKVIESLKARQLELGVPAKDASSTSPAVVVTKSLTYLENHQDKMKYPEYRKNGLPLTSSLMESAVKQINQRVKGSEKFWSEAGSEAVLQLRADYLSGGDIVEAFWDQRQAEATGQRTYRRSI